MKTSWLFCTVAYFCQPAAAQEWPEQFNRDRAERALDIIAAKWNWQYWMPDVTIVFHGPRPGIQAKTNFRSWEIEAWLRPNMSAVYIAGTITHELAHAYDRWYLTDAMRAYWLKIRGLPPDTPWRPKDCKVCTEGQECICDDAGTGAKDWAESVKWTIVGFGAYFNSELKPGKMPNQEQQALIKSWLHIR